jgi:Ala-tRNA(Pro) deacylase
MEQELYNYLDVLGITYKIFEHDAFFTCEQAEAFYAQNTMGTDCKNVFFRNRKGRKHYLCALPAKKNIDIPALAEFLDEHPKMSFASAERLEKYLGLYPGAVSIFGLLHPNAAEVTAIVDIALINAEFVHFHPFRNTASVLLSGNDLKKFLDSLSQNILYWDF